MNGETNQRWTVARLGDLCRVTTGKRDVNEGASDGEYPFFTCAQKIHRINSAPFDGESVLVAGNGFFNVKYYDGKFDAYQRTYVLQSFAIDGKFLYHYIQFKLDDITKGNRGSTINYIRLGDLTEYGVPVPPLNEQRRIATKLDELLSRADVAQMRLASIPRLIKRFRQSVLAAAGSGKLTANWRAGTNDLAPALKLLTRIKQERVKRYENERRSATAESRRPAYNPPEFYDLPDDETLSELPNLPEKWLYCRLENLAEVVRGASPRPAGDPRYFGGNIPWITVAEVTKDENIYLTQVRSFVTEEGKRRSRFIKKGTFLLTNSGATLGVPKITKLSGCINDGSVAFVDIPLTSELFLYYFLKSQTEGLRNIDQGAAQPNLNSEIIKSIVIPLPPLAEQQEIVRRIEVLFKTADALEARYKKAKAHVDKLTKSILAKAFRGELVPQDPNDEPASKLLERIRSGRVLGERPARRKRKAS